MKTKSILYACLLLVVLMQTSLANNNLFLPGDAFFPAKLTLKDIDSLKTNPDQFRFSYSSFDGYSPSFCGYAGYGWAKVDSVDAKFAANLAKAYGMIRKTEPRLLEKKRRF